MSDMKGNAARPVGAELNGPGRAYFNDVVLDNVMDAIMELAAAVWTYRDRSIVLERVLEREFAASGRPLDLSRLIEAYEPTAADARARSAERAEFVDAVFASFARRTQASGATPAGEGR
jgi:hypothetical protein